MFDGLLKSKFYSKCKSDIKLTRARIEMIQKKRNAMQKYLRNDVADLLKNGLGMNAYSRAEGLLIELNRSECYELIDQCCVVISNHLPPMNKQRDCPDECRESVSSLMFAAARIADLPELRELRDVFSEKYGNSLDGFANKELVEKLTSGVPSRDKKLQLLQEIASEAGQVWNSKALDVKLFNEQGNNKDVAKETIDGDLKIKNEFSAADHVKLDDRSRQKKENSPVIKPIEHHDRSSSARNHQDHEEKHRGKYGLIAPPYSKSVAETTKIASEGKKVDDRGKEESKSMPKSVRRRHLKPIRENSDDDKADKAKETNKEQAAQAQKILKFLDKGNDNLDEEELAMDRLLRHYSRMKGTHSRVKSDIGLKPLFEKKEFFKTGSGGSKKEANGKECGPARVLSLPGEMSGLNDKSAFGLNLKPPFEKKESSKTGSSGSKECGPDRVSPGLNEKSGFGLKPPFEKKDFFKTGSGGSKKEANGKECGPSRVLSLPNEVAGPSEKAKRHFRASSFEPAMMNDNHNHVHPKLPDCDDFEARLAELRRK